MSVVCGVVGSDFVTAVFDRWATCLPSSTHRTSSVQQGEHGNDQQHPQQHRDEV
jgi:hypothetical protein